MQAVVMKFRRLFPLLPFLLSVSLPVSRAQEAAAPPAEPAAEQPAEDDADTSNGKVYISKNPNLGWNNSKGLLLRLSNELVGAVKGLEPEKVQAFVSKGKNRLLLAQYMMALADSEVDPETFGKSRAAASTKADELRKKIAELKKTRPGPKKEEREAQKAELEKMEKDLAEVEATLNLPVTMAEFAAQKDSHKLLNAVCGNEQWMEDLVLSGTCKAPGRAMAVLQTIAKQHPEIYKEELPRQVATACAAEWAKSGYPFEKAAPRADYFIRHVHDGRLNPVFDTIPMNIRRVVLGGTCPEDAGNTWFMGNNRAGEVPSMEWALENVHLPEERYTGSCWRNGYKSYNVYGASVQTGDYFTPFDGMYDKNHHQFTYEVGGVCGGLSHFGAYAAIANGVPAMTMGEPGHCAFLVLIRNKWTNAYSVDWDHSPHFTPWDKCWLYQSIFMNQEMYSPAERRATYVSDTYRALAHIMASRKKDKDAMKAFRGAVSAQPLSYGAWRDYAAYVQANHGSDEAAWVQLNDDVCLLLAPRYAEMAGQLLHEYVYPGLQGCAKKPDAALAAVHMYWDNVRSIGPSRWKFNTVLTDQMKLLSPAKPSIADTKTEVTDPKLIMQVYGIAMADCAWKNDWAPLLVEWGNKQAEGAADKGLGKEMVAFSTDLMTHFSNGESGSDMVGNLVRAAEKAKDVDAFQKLAKDLATTKGRTKNVLPNYTKPEGELRSSGGVIYTGKAANDDDAAGHWGVLEPCGGCIKTAALKDAWIGMKFARDSYISSVVAVTPEVGEANGNLVLQGSETGDAGSWQDIVPGRRDSTNRVHTFNIGNELKCKYLRIMRRGGTEPFELNAFHVYGRKAA